MNKKIAIIVEIIGIILFVVGVLLVFNSVYFGNEMLNNMIINNGGSFNAESANIILSANISNIRVIGIAFICFGGASSFYSTMKILSK